MLATVVGVVVVVLSICSIISIHMIGASVRGHEDLGGFHYDHNGS